MKTKTNMKKLAAIFVRQRNNGIVFPVSADALAL